MHHMEECDIEMRINEDKSSGFFILIGYPETCCSICLMKFTLAWCEQQLSEIDSKMSRDQLN